MKLTIAVCTYRRFDWLRKCLEALKNQTLSPEELVLVVVDNSLLKADSTAFRDSLLGFKNLEYIITDKSGLSYARNIAIDRCQTPIIAFIDDDAIAAPDWAEKIIDAFNRYPAAGVIGGRVNPIWEKEPPAWLKGSLLHPLAVLDWGNNDIFVDHNSKWLVGANVSYRTSILRKCGGFSISLGRKGTLLLAHEELATNISIQTHGFDAVYVPSIKVDHLIQAERTTKEWFVTNSMWEGASRVVYECRTVNLDTEVLSESLNNKLIELQKKHKTSDKIGDIQNVLKLFNAAGRKTCIECIGTKSLHQNYDYYFDNIVSVVYIVTPCLNAFETIEQTILSVISQAGEFSIRYHVQDGGSTDGTLEKLSAWNKRLERDGFPVQCKNIVFTFSSGPDHGMYDALVKGFETMSIPPNAFMTWLNADDILMPGAFALIRSIAGQFPSEHVSWVSGAACVIKDDIQITQSERNIPTKVIKSGLCDGNHWIVVQQEGTFFRKWLWDKVGAGDVITDFKYAGDWNLWRLFAHYTALTTVQWPLAAFRKREGQLSQSHMDNYQAEIESVVSITQRDFALRNLVEHATLTSHILKIHYPSGKLSLIERASNGKARNFYNKCFKQWPTRPLNKKEDEAEQIIFTPPQPSQNITENSKKSVFSKQNIGTSSSCLQDDTARPEAKIDNSLNAGTHDRWEFMGTTNFDYLTYARRSHWHFFKGLDEQLYGHKVDLDSVHLKYYQDLLMLAFINAHIPAGSRILEVGGGVSRILKHLAPSYECWNIDKLEGLGNGPKELKNPPYSLVRDYMGNFNSKLSNNYFDLVFSISALEHVPQDDLTLFDRIIDDINRVLKPSGYSLHLFDVIFTSHGFWTNKFVYRIFERIQTINQYIPFDKVVKDPDLYCISEAAFNKTWAHTKENKIYQNHRPSSLNILWTKGMPANPDNVISKQKKTQIVSICSNIQTTTILPGAKTEWATSRTFFIVTPCLNAANTIDQTIQSVISQAGNFSIRYHVQDGGSTDGTIDKLKEWKGAAWQSYVQCQSVEFTWSSSPDQGMYDAIIKGFDSMNIAPSEFMAWINGDDILLPDTLVTITRIAAEHPEIQWIGSHTHNIDQNGKTMTSRPNPTPTAIIREGLCDGRYYHWYHLQQEGTFFKKSLWFRAKHVLRGYSLAGDWALWREFARHAEYYQFDKPLGAFRKRDGQLSMARRDKYNAEIEATLPMKQRDEAFQRLYAQRDMLPANVIRICNPGGKIIVEKEYKGVQEMFDKFWKKNSKGERA